MLLHHLRLAVKNMWRRPGFAVTAILLLALGAGANAVVFAVVRGVLLRPLAFAAPDRLVALWPGEFVSNEDLGYWRAHARSLASVGSVAPGWLMAFVAPGHDAVKVTGAKVSANLFGLLGVTPMLGRGFAPDEHTPGRERVVVLSERLWREQYAGAPSALGQLTAIDEVPHEIIGVMPRGFELLGGSADLWVPVVDVPGSAGQRTTYSLAVGRLQAGVPVDTASRELAGLVPEMQGALGRPRDWGATMRVEGLQDAVTGEVRPALELLLGAVGLILLLGAVNLGTLVLGRSLERSRELAVRAAIGASTRHLVGQTLVEQAVLAAAGALTGLALAHAALPALLARIPADVPRQTEIALDGIVFGTVLTASVAVAVVMALLPALLALRPGVQPLLRQQSNSDHPGRQRALGGLVAAQVALALVLGIGAGLMLRTMWHLQQVDPGFDPTGVIAFRLQTTSKYRSLTTGLPYLRQVAERVAALPGVTAVGAVGHLPMSGYSWTIPVHRPDRPLAPGAEAPHVGWRFIWGDYFGAMRIPVTTGRAFTDGDLFTAAPVAIVNDALAREFFGSASAALGQRLVQHGGGRPGDITLEIVGVVGDVHHEGLGAAAGAEIYRPLLQTFMFPMQMVARAAGDPAALVEPIRRAAAAVDPMVPVAELQTVAALVSGTLARPRLLTGLLALFAVIGLALSVVGLYGVVAVRVRQREREIGIRMALGAAPRAMAGAVVRQGLGHAAVGLLLGLPAALGLARLMASLVFGVSVHDPLTFVALPALIVIVTAVATYVPARRAARVDPVTAIKAAQS